MDGAISLRLCSGFVSGAHKSDESAEIRIFGVMRESCDYNLAGFRLNSAWRRACVDICILVYVCQRTVHVGCCRHAGVNESHIADVHNGGGWNCVVLLFV